MTQVFSDYTADEWGTFYDYTYAGISICTITSCGIDKTIDTADDITLTVRGDIREKLARVQEELEVIKKAAQQHCTDQGPGPPGPPPTYPNLTTLFTDGYLNDASYQTDEWGTAYQQINIAGPGRMFYSWGPDLTDDSLPNGPIAGDDIAPY